MLAQELDVLEKMSELRGRAIDLSILENPGYRPTVASLDSIVQRRVPAKNPIIQEMAALVAKTVSLLASTQYSQRSATRDFFIQQLIP